MNGNLLEGKASTFEISDLDTAELGDYTCKYGDIDSNPVDVAVPCTNFDAILGSDFTKGTIFIKKV